MSGTFTPGPWWAAGAAINSDPVPVAKVNDHYSNFEANARLIAASPDLYAALKAFQHHVTRHSCVWDDAENGSHHHPVWQQVADALAKVRGEQ